MEKHINWEKINGLLPVIVQDATSGTVLMNLTDRKSVV